MPLADFHGQLLRVVYRLIFLFVAEDRTIDGQSLLHPRDDSEAAQLARERYAAHYSTARLRELACTDQGQPPRRPVAAVPAPGRRALRR